MFKNQRGEGEIAIFLMVVFLLALTITLGMWGLPKYKIYKLDGLGNVIMPGLTAKQMPHWAISAEAELVIETPALAG